MLEPWCKNPEQIARLTDYQIVHMLLLPQMRRQEELERQQKNLPARADEIAEMEREDEIPPRPIMIGMFVSLGMSPEEANREYDARLAAHYAAKGRKP